MYLEIIGHGLIEVLYRKLPGGTEEIHEPSVKIFGVSAKIQREELLNMDIMFL
jgi:hypothetical protein